MKARRIVILSLLIALTVTAVWCGSAANWQHRLAGDMVRLRVVADSDDPTAQARKLLVRDAVLARAGELLKGEENAASAAQTLCNNLDSITLAARSVLDKEGCTDEVQSYVTWERAGSRDYGSFLLPAGGYVTLRVDLGSGEGKNWWCVVFPPVCQAGAEEAVLPASLSPEDRQRLMGGEEKYVLRFRTLELLRDVEDWLAGLKK